MSVKPRGLSAERVMRESPFPATGRNDVRRTVLPAYQDHPRGTTKKEGGRYKADVRGKWGEYVGGRTPQVRPPTQMKFRSGAGRIGGDPETTQSSRVCAPTQEGGQPQPPAKVKAQR